MEINRGIMYFSGGGDADKTAAVDLLFLTNLSSKNILFIPIAKTRDTNCYKKSCKWVSEKLNKLSKNIINVSMVLDLNKCKNLDKISAVYLGGGNTYKLLKLMHDSGFLLVLKDYIQNGGTVYGASAGAVLMGKDISTFIEEKYLLENEKYKYNLTEGMALVGNYSIITHYHDDDYPKIDKYFRTKDNPVIAIPEGAGFVLKDGLLKVIGNRDIFIIEKRGIITRITPNSIFMV